MLCLFSKGPSKLKRAIFNLTTGTEGITQLLSQTLSDPNVIEDTNVTLLPKRELFFEHVLEQVLKCSEHLLL